MRGCAAWQALETLARYSRIVSDVGHCVLIEERETASIRLAPANGTVADRSWRYEMQFNPDYSAWALDKPLTVAKGETFRTQCNWQNTTDGPLAFPREMCFGVGFFLSDGTSSPVCISGTWIER